MWCRYGGLTPLLRIIARDSGYSQDVQEQAVLAIAEIARNNRVNQTAIGEVTSGAVFSLVTLLLYSKNRRIEVQCPWAMLALAENHETNKQVLSEAGAIPALVTQLSTVADSKDGDSSAAANAPTRAASSLAALAMENEKNQAEIATQLVNLLEEPNPTQARDLPISPSFHAFHGLLNPLLTRARRALPHPGARGVVALAHGTREPRLGGSHRQGG